MARKLLVDRIASHKEKMARDQARLDLMQARAKKDQRKRETRQKVLIGAAVVSELERDPEFRRRVMQLLHVAITRPADRAVLHHLLDEASLAPEQESSASDGKARPAAKATVSSAAAEVGRPAPVATESLLAELDAIIDRSVQPNGRSERPEAEANVAQRTG